MAQLYSAIMLTILEDVRAQGEVILTEQRSLLVFLFGFLQERGRYIVFYESCLHSKFQPTYANLLSSNITHDSNIMSLLW